MKAETLLASLALFHPAEAARAQLSSSVEHFPKDFPDLAVFGHKVPDTDAVCAAIAYAWELGQDGFDATPYVLGELNPETEYVLKTFGLEKPALLEGRLENHASVALVDTNNPMELPENVEHAHIHSVVDHHKLAGMWNKKPLVVDMRPLCSTGSVIYERAKTRGRTPPKEIAACMLSCILSDSLEFRSPTTTDEDRVYAAELANITGLDIHQHAKAMLKARGQCHHLSPKDLVMMDTKVFPLGGRSVRVSVMETTDPDMPLGKKEQLVEAMRNIVKEQRLADCLFFVVDILKERAIFVSSSDTARRMVEAAWGKKLEADGTLLLPGVMSRKAQIIPALQTAMHDDGDGSSFWEQA